jgi:hypothetical protein
MGGPWSRGDDPSGQGHPPREETGANRIRSGRSPHFPCLFHNAVKDTSQLTNLPVLRSVADRRGPPYIQLHVRHTGQANRLFGGN